MIDTSKQQTPTSYDVVFLHSRRESIVLLTAFLVFFGWCLGTTFVLGYAPRAPQPVDQTIPTLFGIPRWVFWGVAVPWLGANVFTFWFCLFSMKDDPLGETTDECVPPDSVGVAAKESH